MTDGMVTPGSSTAEEQVGLLAAIYSKRAAAYDALWSPVIRPLGELLLDNLPLAQARDVVDIGCGAGALLPAIRARAPNATVLGVDRSEGMLELARQKHPGPFALLDAQDLDLPPESFDVAVLAYVLFHLPDPLRCLRGVARILRPRGSAGVVTWGEEEPPDASAVWDEELAAAGARPFELSAVDSTEVCDTPDKVGALLAEAGLEVRRAWLERIEHRWAAADHYEWHVQGSSGMRLASLQPEARGACLARVRERLGGLGEEHYVYRGEVIMAMAQKPY